MKRRRKQCGFTLAEILIVVAIIGVLVAVAIPVFSGQLEKAREATCTANSRSLKSALSAELILGDTTESEIASVTLTKDDGYTYSGNSYPCPSGGKLTAYMENGQVMVSCSVHGLRWTNSAITSAIWNELLTGLNSNKYTSNIDSASTSGTQRAALLAALAAQNIDLDKLGATSWRLVRDSAKGDYFQWTSVDITTLQPGETFAVIRYRLNAGSSNDYTGVYSVWEGAVGSYNGTPTVSTNSSHEYTAGSTIKDIDNAIAVYNANKGVGAAIMS